MNPEQLDRIGQLLHSAPPLQPILTAYRAYTLIGLLQLALRHPLMQNVHGVCAEHNRPSVQIGREMGNGLIAQLGRIDPLIAQSLDQGWTPEFDLTEAEAAEYFNDPEPPEETIAKVIEFNKVIRPIAQHQLYYEFAYHGLNKHERILKTLPFLIRLLSRDLVSWYRKFKS